MKPTIIKCGICDSWFLPFRGHCPICAASLPMVMAGKTHYLDTSSGREVIKGDRVFHNVIERVVAKV